MRILLCMSVVAGCLAAQSTVKATTQSKPATPKKAPAPLTIPKDAVETKVGFFQWTDKDGKVWMYRRTPFGVSRWPADSEDIKKSDIDKEKAVSTRTVATEVGDSIRFEQSTPFGKRVWVRKKSDLDDVEQKIWAEQKNGATARTAEKE